MGKYEENLVTIGKIRLFHAIVREYWQFAKQIVRGKSNALREI